MKAVDVPLPPSPVSRPPLGPPPRSRARPSPSPGNSGLNSPANHRRTSSVPDANALKVAKTLDYGEPDPSPPSPKDAAEEEEPCAAEWSTPALPSFKDDSPRAAVETVSFSIPSPPEMPTAWSAPALPPRTSSLGATSPSPTTWTFPVSQLPPPSPSSFLKPPTSPEIPDSEAVGPLPKRRSSSGVYTPATFPGPSPRKSSAPASSTIRRPSTLEPTSTYRKASEGTGLGLGAPIGFESGSSVSQPPSAGTTASSGSWWSSARNYFASPPTTPLVPVAGSPVPSSYTSLKSPTSPLPSDAPTSPLASPSAAAALFPCEDDTMLPTGSLSPSGLYTPRSFWSTGQLGQTTPTAAQTTFPSRSVPPSPRASLSAGTPTTLPKSPSSQRKPAPVDEEGETEPHVVRKPVPTYHGDTFSSSTADRPLSASESMTTASSLGPSTPAFEQADPGQVKSNGSAQTTHVDEQKGGAGFGGFKGLGKEMQVLQVELPVDVPDSAGGRVW